MIIDSHVHFCLEAETDDSESGRKLIQSSMHAGISACVASNVVAETSCGGGAYPSSAHLRRVNDFAAKQVRKNQGRLHFLVYLNPQNPDWEAELEHGIRDGAVGIKLWIALKNSRGGLEETKAVLQKAAEVQLPVLLHVFNRTGGNLPGEIDMTEFAALSRAVPACIMIAGHTGGNWRESSSMLDYCSPNTFWETGGSNPDYGMVDGILKSCPPERLLYGSDAPGRAFFPQIRKILESSLSPAEQELVFCQNALKIFRIPCPLPVMEIAERAASRRNLEMKEDHFCFCGKYPFDRRDAVTPSEWDNQLQKLGIGTAYTAAFECIFHVDLLESNQDFLKQCEGTQRVRPLAVVNPAAHNWNAVLDKIYSGGGFSGIWVSPAFHCWNLSDKCHQVFFRRCAELDIPIWINCGFSEARFFHASLKIRSVEDCEIREFMKNAPQNVYVFQGCLPPGELPVRTDCFWCLSAFADSGSRLEQFLQMGPQKLVWGSEFPFRAPDSVFDCISDRLSASPDLFRQFSACIADGKLPNCANGGIRE